MADGERAAQGSHAATSDELATARTEPQAEPPPDQASQLTEGRAVPDIHEMPPATAQAPPPPAHSLFAGQSSAPQSSANTDESSAPLLGSETDSLRHRWQELQALFVDDPIEAVRSADELVTEVIRAIAGRLEERKHDLELQWQRGAEVSTEDLRLALRQYREFFGRLLSI